MRSYLRSARSSLLMTARQAPNLLGEMKVVNRILPSIPWTAGLFHLIFLHFSRSARAPYLKPLERVGVPEGYFSAPEALTVGRLALWGK